MIRVTDYQAVEISVRECRVCSYLDKYLSYYIIFILLVSTPLFTVTGLCSYIIVCN